MNDLPIMLVVHDRALYKALINRRDSRYWVCLERLGTHGRCVASVVFVDSPRPDDVASDVWRESYRDWVATAVLTRIAPGGSFVGLTEVGESDATRNFNAL